MVGMGENDAPDLGLGPQAGEFYADLDPWNGEPWWQLRLIEAACFQNLCSLVRESDGILDHAIPAIEMGIPEMRVPLSILMGFPLI